MVFALFFQNCGEGLRALNAESQSLSSRGEDAPGTRDPANVEENPPRTLVDISALQGLPLRKVVEHPLFPKDGFLVGYALPQIYSTPNNDSSVNCFATAGNPDNEQRFGRCFNGRPGAVIAHLDFASQEFNFMTPESSLKMNVTQPNDPGVNNGLGNFTYDHEDVDRMIASLGIEQGEMALHGHTLIWYTSNPGWLNQVTSAQELRTIMENRIVQVLRHYRGRNMVVWDVVNEAIKEDEAAGFGDGNPVRPADISQFLGNRNSTAMFRTANNKWIELLGPEYIRLAFQIARNEINTWPQAERPLLIYNDYDILWKSVKSDAVFELVKYLNQGQKLVDAVGFQAHLWSDFKRNGVVGTPLKELKHTDPNRQLLAHETVPGNLQRFADLGLDIYITEMDVRLRDLDGRPPFASLNDERPQSPAQDRDQYDIYKTVVTHCLNQSRCKGFQVWGLSDTRSWMGGHQPLLFKGHPVLNAQGTYVYEKKAAYDGVLEALLEYTRGGPLQ